MKINLNLNIGNWVEALIYVLTFGYGHKIANYLAMRILGKESCGCERRKIWLNNLFKSENNKKYPI